MNFLYDIHGLGGNPVICLAYLLNYLYLKILL